MLHWFSCKKIILKIIFFVKYFTRFEIYRQLPNSQASQARAVQARAMVVPAD
jgi:hypothetical protein